MKTNRIATTVLFAFLVIGNFISCTEDDILLKSDNKPLTRAVVDGNDVSISNPSLLSNWENVKEIKLNTLGTDNKNVIVSSPWNGDGNASPLPESFRKDIKKEDGWKMLFHTFKDVGTNPGVNYMCFYNQFTGFIKIFFYREAHLISQGAQWYIKTSEGKQIKLLDEPTYLSRIDSHPATNDMLLFSTMNDVPTTGIEFGWNGFEFQVSRYSTDLTNMDLKIGAYEKHITDYDLLGKADLENIGTVTTTTENSSGVSKAIANLAGPQAEKYVDRLGEGLFGDRVIFGERVSNLIKKIPGSSFISLLQSGLDLIFGKTTSTSSSDVTLTTTGTIKLSGTSSATTTADIPILNFNLYNVLNNSTSNTTNTNLVRAASTTSGEHYLGVWTLKKKPVIYYNRIEQVLVEPKYGVGDIGQEVTLQANISMPQIHHYDLEPVINPDLLPYVKDYSFSAQFMVCNKLDGKPYKEGSKEISSEYGRWIDLYSDDQVSFMELPDLGHKYVTGIAINKDDFDKNQGHALWYDWGKIIDGRVLAVVRLDMTCECEGKETQIHQSRVYEVEYGIDTTLTQPEDAHHPPITIVVNYGTPFTLRYNWK